MKNEELISRVAEVIGNLKAYVNVPIGTSNRHIHLTEQDFKKLFPYENLTIKKMLTQPGEYASEETLSVIGPKGELKNVRILGPFRKQSQVELSMTDARQIGLQVPIRMSGDIDNTPGVILKSKYGELELKEGAIVAKRHIHMTTRDAELLNLTGRESVSVEVKTDDRTLIFEECMLRVSDNFVFEMHIDTDEANAAGITSTTYGKII